MEDEIDTSAEAETDDVQPEQSDNAPEWDYYDPDEDTVEDHEAATDDDGSTEAEDPEQEVETETEDEAEAQYFDLPDGSRVSQDEALKGYLRQSDYTRKATEVAEQRRMLESENQRMQGVIDAFADFLKPLVEGGPDPALASTDPARYTQLKAQHDAVQSEVNRLLQIGQQAKQVQSNLSEADMQRTIAQENRALAEKMPETLKQEGRQKFFDAAYTAAEQLGFSQQELNGITDHRAFMLAYWAQKGMQAEEARKKASSKAAKAPPTTPNKPGSKANRNRNAEAMRRLSKTGSIRDALAIDFE